MGNVNAISNDKVLETAFGLSGASTNTDANQPTQRPQSFADPPRAALPRGARHTPPPLTTLPTGQGWLSQPKGLCYHNHVQLKHEAIFLKSGSFS